MSRIIAIGDIHGCSKTFRKLLYEDLCIELTDEIYCLGDYIDRGYDSKGVIDFILELRENKFQIHTLRGNHEEMMMVSTLNEEFHENWLKVGGNRTLASFGVNSFLQLQPVYQKFFNETKLFIEKDNYIFVHAGLNFRNNNLFEDKKAMLWIRDLRIDKKKLGDRVIIHGHDPKTIDYVLNQKIENAVNIDAGCVFKGIKGFGNLVALNLTDMKFVVAENVE